MSPLNAVLLTEKTMSEFNSSAPIKYRNQLGKYPPIQELEKADWDLFAYYRDLAIEQCDDYDYVDKGVRLIPLTTSPSLESCSDEGRVYILGLANEIIEKVYGNKADPAYTDEILELIFKANHAYVRELMDKWSEEE
jgi:hypothetical protein